VLLENDRIKYLENNSQQTNHLFAVQSLNDILECTNNIREFLEVVNNDLEKFISTTACCRAIERCFGIIKEATKRVHLVYQDLKINNVKAVSNLISKQYFEIEPEQVWILANTDIPKLKEEVKQIINTLKAKNHI